MGIGKEYSQAPPAVETPTDALPEGTVWLRHDEAIQQKGDFPPEAHWSNQITQPLQAYWPVEPSPSGQHSSTWGGRRLRPVLAGAGWGGILAFLALSLLLLVAVNNGFLFSNTSASSESVPRPASVQPATPKPTRTHSRKSHPPKRDAAPKGPVAVPTSAPTATPPAAPSPTAPPTVQPTTPPTPAPTATPPPQPTATPAPAPTATSAPGSTSGPTSGPTPQPTAP